MAKVPEVTKCCGTCKFWDAALDVKGRRKVSPTYRCLVPDPELPPLPASVPRSGPLGFTWPPQRSYMRKDEGTDCPYWGNWK